MAPVNCSVCSADLGDIPPEICPNCFTLDPCAAAPSAPSATSEASDPARATPTRPEPATPTAGTTACATEGCTGVPPPGAWFCVTCQLINDGAERSVALVGTWGELPVPDGGELVVGRHPQKAPVTAVMLHDADRVSRVHAILHNRGGALILVDQSTNGTSVNGRTIPSDVEHTVLPGDRIIFGTQVEFEVREA